MTTTQDLRKFLTEEMQKLRDGTITAKSAATTARLGNIVVKSINSDLANKRMEIKLARTIPKKLQSIKL